jgi:diguanylate cyclase (GGDEF)-like protein/PAS domain S-box-containing protein
LKIIQANPSFGTILGCNPDDVTGSRIDRFSPDGEMSLVREHLATLDDEVVESTELDTQAIKADGTAIWLRWTASAVRTRDGEIEYYLVMLQDVSERRSTEDTLKAAYAEMEVLVAQRTAELQAANQRLSNEAVSDPLTGLYNRRYLADFVERELSRTRRSGNRMVFVIIDIDHFKRINDTFGHDAGDHVLREVSAYLRAQIRQEDLAFRYGGEEFLLVLPTAGAEAVRGRIEQVRERIARRKIEHDNRDLGTVTFSLGVAVFPDHGDTADAVIASADDALYRAKEGGRNRVVYVADPA